MKNNKMLLTLAVLTLLVYAPTLQHEIARRAPETATALGAPPVWLEGLADLEASAVEAETSKDRHGVNRNEAPGSWVNFTDEDLGFLGVRRQPAEEIVLNEIPHRLQRTHDFDQARIDSGEAEKLEEKIEAELTGQTLASEKDEARIREQIEKALSDKVITRDQVPAFRDLLRRLANEEAMEEQADLFEEKLGGDLFAEGTYLHIEE